MLDVPGRYNSMKQFFLFFFSSSFAVVGAFCSSFGGIERGYYFGGNDFPIFTGL